MKTRMLTHEEMTENQRAIYEFVNYNVKCGRATIAEGIECLQRVGIIIAE